MKDVIRDGRQEPLLPEPTFRYEDEQQPDGTILRRAVLVGELPVADGYEDEDTLYARIEQAERDLGEALALLGEFLTITEMRNGKGPLLDEARAFLARHSGEATDVQA